MGNFYEKINIIQEIYDDFLNGRTKEETRYEQTFNNLFWEKLLGYESKKNRHPQSHLEAHQEMHERRQQ